MPPPPGRAAASLRSPARAKLSFIARQSSLKARDAMVGPAVRREGARPLPAYMTHIVAPCGAPAPKRRRRPRVALEDPTVPPPPVAADLAAAEAVLEVALTIEPPAELLEAAGLVDELRVQRSGLMPPERIEHDRRIVAARERLSQLCAQHAASIELAAAPALVAAARAVLEAADRLQHAGRVAALAVAAVNRADGGHRHAIPVPNLAFAIDAARRIVDKANRRD